jgi:hypothetical protein
MIYLLGQHFITLQPVSTEGNLLSAGNVFQEYAFYLIEEQGPSLDQFVNQLRVFEGQQLTAESYSQNDLIGRIWRELLMLY